MGAFVVGVGLHGGDVGVHKDDLDAFLLQRLDRLLRPKEKKIYHGSTTVSETTQHEGTVRHNIISISTKTHRLRQGRKVSGGLGGGGRNPLDVRRFGATLLSKRVM